MPNYRRLESIAQPLASEHARRTARESFTSPRRLGTYDIHSEIGRGGMGVVYRARDIRSERWVALKMIASGEFASGAEIARLHAEADAVAQLDHPGIVKILETGEVDGHPYIAMELLEGGGLDRHLPAFAASPEAAVELIACVARAVQAAHERGILHRDLKASNIVFDANGRVVVTDFGLARRIGAEDGLTSSGELLGTLSAMAPEQAECATKQLTAAVDVYALGVILYEVLTGRPPFRGNWAPELLRQILYDEPVLPSRIEPVAPRAVDAICLRCLEKRPARRYRTAAALAADLDRFREGKSVQARLPGVLVRTARFIRRRPALTAIVAALALVLVALPVGVLWHVAELEQRADELERREALRRRSAYAARLNLAYVALERHLYRRTLQLLESLVPASGEKDIRGFGWRHLWRRAHPEKHTLRGHRQPISGVKFLNGSRILTMSGDGEVRLWDAFSGDHLGSSLIPDGDFSFCADISMDGRLLAQAHGDLEKDEWRLSVKELDALGASLESRVISTLESPRSVSALAFSPDSRSLVVAEWDGDLSILTAPDWSTRRCTIRNDETIFTLEFSPDGGEVATGDGRGRVKIRDSDTLAVLREFDAGSGVAQLAYSPDGASFARSRDAGVIELWDTPSWTMRDELRTGALDPESVEIYRMHFISARELAVCATVPAPVVEIIDLDGSARRRVIRGHEEKVTWIAAKPDTRVVATGSDDHVVKIWDLASPDRPLRYEYQGEIYDQVALSSDTSFVVATTRDFELHVLGIDEARAGGVLRPMGTLEWSAEGRRDEALSSDGRRVVLAYDESRVEIHHIELASSEPSSRVEAQLEFDGEAVTGVEFAPESLGIVVSTADGKVHVFDASWRRSAVVETGMPDLSDVAIAPDGRTIALTRRRRPEVYIHDVTGGELLTTLSRHTKWVVALAFSADSLRLATGGLDHAIMLWDVDRLRDPRRREHEPRKALLGHANAVTSLDFLPDGLLVSGSDDTTIKLWDIEIGEERATLRSHRRFVNALSVSRDGETIVSAGGRRRDFGDIVLWRTGADDSR